jgi:hypothetical protein
MDGNLFGRKTKLLNINIIINNKNKIRFAVKRHVSTFICLGVGIYIPYFIHIKYQDIRYLFLMSHINDFINFCYSRLPRKTRRNF